MNDMIHDDESVIMKKKRLQDWNKWEIDNPKRELRLNSVECWIRWMKEGWNCGVGGDCSWDSYIWIYCSGDILQSWCLDDRSSLDLTSNGSELFLRLITQIREWLIVFILKVKYVLFIKIFLLIIVSELVTDDWNAIKNGILVENNNNK